MGDARDAFVLGRYAMRVSGSTQVIALGGGGITESEARCSTVDRKESSDPEVHWQVYAMARAEKPRHPTLCDFAAQQAENKFITLTTGKDPQEAEAYCRYMKSYLDAAAAFLRGGTTKVELAAE